MLRICFLLAAMLMTGKSFAIDRDAKILQKNNPPLAKKKISPMVGHYRADAFEIGGRYSFEVVHHGFVKAINDSVDVEISAFLRKNVRYTSEDLKFFVLSGLRWDFHVADKWTAFGMPEIGLNLFQKHGIPDPDVGAVVGAMYIQPGSYILRMEASSTTYTTHFGLVFPF